MSSSPLAADERTSKSISDEEASILPRRWTLYASRWWILFFFSFLSWHQSMFWFTFSPVAESTERFYGWHDAQVNLMISFGCIIFLPMCVPTSWILEKKGGLRKAVVLCAAVEIVIAFLRLLTLFDPRHWTSLVLISAVQLINGAIGPLVMNAPPLVSEIWFADNEKARATAISTMANWGGSAVGAILMPLIVKWFSVPALLWFHVGEALLCCVPILIYFPAAPPTPPSASAAACSVESVVADLGGKQKKEADNRSLWSDIATLLRNPSFCLLILVGGGVQGIFTMWSAVFDVVLKPYHFSQTAAGWLAFATMLGGIVGGLVSGWLGDTYFRCRIKLLLLLFFYTALLFLAWFTLSLPSPVSASGILAYHPYYVLLIAAAGTGFGAAGTAPVFLELASEMAYPIPQGTAAAMLTFFNNLCCFSALFIQPLLAPDWANCMLFIALVLCIVTLFFIKETYKRVTASAIALHESGKIQF